MEERMKILNNIIEIKDEDNIIEISNIKLEFSCNKYSAKKNNIYHITLNGKHLVKKDKYRIKYKCISCENVHIIGVTQFIRKVQKCSHRCNLCCNKDESKREQHKDFLKKYNYEEKISLSKSLLQIREESIKLFQDYDDDFKDNYFKNHLTDEDYKRISNNLISLQNGNIVIDENVEYWSIFKTNNQMLFTSVFYDKKNDMIVKANQPILKCDICSQIWRAKTIERFKNCHKIMCNNCTLCNKTFKIRTTKNNINQPIMYQSKLELKFINWCEMNNKTIINGPIISYDFEDKVKKYRVDFQIGDILIEIKDNHIWHNNEIKSGKWTAKTNGVYNEIKKGNYKDYMIITPKNWICMLEKIRTAK